MSGQRERRPTPSDLNLLEQVGKGRVRWIPTAEAAVMRSGREVVDVSGPLGAATQAGWAYIEPYDPYEWPQPSEVPCLLTPAGEDVLMEAEQAKRDKQRKAGAR